jgi:hypothetical protein
MAPERRSATSRYSHERDPEPALTGKHYILEIEWGEFSRPHFLYKLGKAIRPAHDVKIGGLYGLGHVWCALDLLLTSKTISEAQKLTRKREEKSE